MRVAGAVKHLRVNLHPVAPDSVKHPLLLRPDLDLHLIVNAHTCARPRKIRPKVLRAPNELMPHQQITLKTLLRRIGSLSILWV